jgi:hypothetical protein
MRSYEAARNLFGFLGFCAWCVIVLGVVVAFLGGTAARTGFRSGSNELQALLGAAPGAVLALGGFFGLAMVQIGRAAVDSAEYGQQALEVSRQQLEVSREALAQGKTAAASYAEILKRQPVSKVHPADKVADGDTGASYGSRPVETAAVAQLSDTSEQAELSAKAKSTPAQLENAPELSVDGMLTNGDPVTFENGVWLVGGRTFQAEAPARNYAAQLGVNPKAKSSDA